MRADLQWTPFLLNSLRSVVLGHMTDRVPHWRWNRVHLSSIHIQIHVDLVAQVEVEEGVDAEDKEEDCGDDQECILRGEKETLLRSLFIHRLSLCTGETELCLNVSAW